MDEVHLPEGVIVLAEDEYQFGKGKLRLLPAAVLESRTEDGVPWLLLRGVEYHWSGEPLGERDAWVRRDKVPAKWRARAASVTRHRR